MARARITGMSTNYSRPTGLGKTMIIDRAAFDSAENIEIGIRRRRPTVRPIYVLERFEAVGNPPTLAMHVLFTI